MPGAGPDCRDVPPYRARLAYGQAMTTEGEAQPPQADAAHLDDDAAHLDDDVEALEDPVHCGDALHQHELHEQQRHPAG